MKGGDNILTASSVLVDFSDVDFTIVSGSIAGAVPSALPIVLTIVGVRKTISIVMGLIRGA